MSLVIDSFPNMHQSIGRQNIRDSVAATLASLIASGIIQVGDNLPSERQLAQALCVSRESVRGAIQMLASDGLLSVVQGARTRVIDDNVGAHYGDQRQANLINNYSLDDIQASRMLVERQVVGEAAERIDATTLSDLDDCLRSQREALSDPVRFLITDREFHLAIYRCCGNEVLANFVSELYGYMMEHRRKAVAEPDATAKSLADHEVILEALNAHDRQAVVDAFEIHIDRIYQTTQSILSRQPG